MSVITISPAITLRAIRCHLAACDTVPRREAHVAVADAAYVRQEGLPGGKSTMVL